VQSNNNQYIECLSQSATNCLNSCKLSNLLHRSTMTFSHRRRLTLLTRQRLTQCRGGIYSRYTAHRRLGELAVPRRNVVTKRGVSDFCRPVTFLSILHTACRMWFSEQLWSLRLCCCNRAVWEAATECASIPSLIPGLNKKVLGPKPRAISIYPGLEPGTS
jgi:hypothetical protein